VAGLPALGHGQMSLLSSVVERAEPLVPRDFQIAVVTLEVAMMHLVVKGSKSETPLVFHQRIWIGWAAITQWISTEEKNRKCSMGCMESPDHGPTLVFLWCKAWATR